MATGLPSPGSEPALGRCRQARRKPCLKAQFCVRSFQPLFAVVCCGWHLSPQPILTFLAETKEYLAGELRNGDPATGKRIAAHPQMVFAFVPKTVKTLLAHADSGFCCRDAVEVYESAKMRVHYRGPQDGAIGGAGEGGRVAAVARDRRRWAVRILASAGWLGQSVSVPGAALV